MPYSANSSPFNVVHSDTADLMRSIGSVEQHYHPLAEQAEQQAILKKWPLLQEIHQQTPIVKKNKQNNKEAG